MRNPYAPDESPSQLFAEKTWLQGALLSNIVYGIEVSLFAICFKLLFTRTNRMNERKQLMLLTFVTVLFILGTIFVYSLSEFTQLAFIENRNYPGGPAAYEEAMFWVPASKIGTVVFVMGNWLMDLLLVWRCMVIFTGITLVPLWTMMVLPCLLFVTSFALGILFLIKTSASSPYFAVNISLAYFCATLALNVIVTIFIVARLLFYRWRFARILGKQHVSHYANVAAILVESASLYSAFSIFFIVPFAINNPLSSISLQAMGQVQTVSSFLIILRVATGQGWTEATSTQVMMNPRSTAISFENASGLQLNQNKSPSETFKMGVSVTHEVCTDQEDFEAV